MITNFKIFENLVKLTKVKIGSMWLITGDIYYIFSVLSILQSYTKSRLGILIKRLIRDIYPKHSIGIILYYSEYGFSYSPIKNYGEISDLIQKGSQLHKFKGEIKLINGGLFIDKTQKEIIKYNL